MAERQTAIDGPGSEQFKQTLIALICFIVNLYNNNNITTIRVVEEQLYRRDVWRENICYTHTYWPEVVLALIWDLVSTTGYHWYRPSFCVQQC